MKIVETKTGKIFKSANWLEIMAKSDCLKKKGIQHDIIIKE